MGIQQHVEVAAQVAGKVTPVSAGIGLSTFFGIDWDILLKVFAASHLCLMMAYYAWKWHKEYRDDKEERQHKKETKSCDS
jgi:hypothetical protein